MPVPHDSVFVGRTPIQALPEKYPKVRLRLSGELTGVVEDLTSIKSSLAAATATL